MTLGFRWPLLGAAFGATFLLSLFVFARGSLMEWALFLPLVLAALLASLVGLIHSLRKGYMIRLDADGQGTAPILAHIAGRRHPRRFTLSGETLTYDRPWLLIDPPVRTEDGETIDKVFLDGRFTGGGTDRIEAFMHYAQGIESEREEGH